MKKETLLSRRTAALSIPAFLMLSACSSAPTEEAENEGAEEMPEKAGGEWVTLFTSDNPSLEDWNILGEDDWKIADDGSVEATGDMLSFLVSKQDYTNFELHVEFWADEPANSGVFLRCSSREAINQDNAYEVNIFDQRPDQTYATGAVVGVAPPSQQMLAANQWNIFDITIEGNHIMVTMNGVKTVDVEHAGWESGPIALQHGAGTIKFRKVEIRPI